MGAHSCPTTHRGMNLHAQWGLVFFNRLHSVTKMSLSEHQVLPEGYLPAGKGNKITGFVISTGSAIAY